MNMTSSIAIASRPADAISHPAPPCEKSIPQSNSTVVLPRDTLFFHLKMVVDRVLALLLLLPGLPLIGLLVVAVRLESKGAGIYRQLRVGHCGRVFTLYKIRSMTSDAEYSLGPTWAGVDGDSRVTKLGYWLRKLHLDELPQLVNVLRGEMSLVGPRPERPEFVKPLAEQIPGYLDRLRIPPGITGLAQVNLPADTDLDSVRRKLILDLEYLDNAGVGLDLRILLCTLGRVFGLRGGRAVSLLGLVRKVTLPTTTTRFDQAEAGPKALSALLFSSECEESLATDSLGMEDLLASASADPNP